MARRKSIMEPIPVKKFVDFDNVTLPEIVNLFTTFSEATGIPLNEVRVETDWDRDVYLTGLRPPTEKEIAKRREAAAKAEERSRKAREARETKERAELARLSAKYGTHV